MFQGSFRAGILKIHAFVVIEFTVSWHRTEHSKFIYPTSESHLRSFGRSPSDLNMEYTYNLRTLGRCQVPTQYPKSKDTKALPSTTGTCIPNVHTPKWRTRKLYFQVGPHVIREKKMIFFSPNCGLYVTLSPFSPLIILFLTRAHRFSPIFFGWYSDPK